jgi:hypothetical protein
LLGESQIDAVLGEIGLPLPFIPSRHFM